MTDSPTPPRPHWTPARQRIFLSALLATGSVTGAAKAAGMSRSSAQRLRTRLAGTPFDRGWSHALTLHARQLADPFAPDPGVPAPAAPPQLQRRGDGASTPRA